MRGVLGDARDYPQHRASAEPLALPFPSSHATSPFATFATLLGILIDSSCVRVILLRSTNDWLVRIGRLSSPGNGADPDTSACQ